MRIAIAGLGLIGGSLAKAIKERTKYHVTGFDASAEVCAKANAAGAADAFGTAGFADADIVLVALNPGAAADFIRAHAARFKRGALVVDMCGVKRYLYEALGATLAGRDFVFIGGHPMAGREFSGFDHAIPTLFENADMILTPDDSTPPDALRTTKVFFAELGFRGVTLTTPERHDEMIAFTSQLAHIVSGAYVQSPAARASEGFSAGSFGDMTRVAKLNEAMWTELFLLNGDFLTEQIDGIIRNLTAFRARIADGDAEGLRALLQRGSRIKEEIGGV